MRILLVAYFVPPTRDTGAQRVFVTHGYTAALARFLSERGLDATPWRTHYEGEPESAE